MGEKILIVDDDLESLKLIGLMLQRRGYQISAAQSGAQALVKASEEKPDLIILDVMMPDMDGYEVCRRLRANPATADLPVIMFTAKTLVKDKVAGFQAGADDYLTKPIHPTELASRVEKVLLRTAHTRAEARRASSRAWIVSFLGVKGGVGTTTTAVNVAVSLAQRQAQDERQQVVLADMPWSMGNVALLLGLTPHQGGLSGLLTRRAGELTRLAVQRQMVTHSSGLQVLPSPIEPIDREGPLLESTLYAVFEHLATEADFLLLDLGSGLNEVQRHLVERSDRLFILVEPQRIAMAMAQALLTDLESLLPLERVQVILFQRYAATALSPETVENLLGCPVVGLIPAAPELAFQAAEQGIPVVMFQPDSPLAVQFRQLADHIAANVP